MRGVFLDVASLHPDDLDLAPLRACLPDWQFYAHTNPDQVLQHIEGAQVVITNKVALSQAHIQAAPTLRLICVAATGTNTIDLDAASAADVLVCNVRDYATASVVEHVFGLVLTLLRHMDSYRQQVSCGNWSKSAQFCVIDETIEELAGKTLGIIGYGTLGQAVARLARAFSMRVNVAQRLYGAPFADRVPLDELLATSDIVTLHCPLTVQTRGLIGQAQLQRMKTSALFINTARGALIDEQALLEALQKGWIAGAAIDVLAEEPPSPSNALLQYRSPRLIVTPHIAWASQAARQRLVNELASNLQGFLQARPRNRVN